MSFLPPSRLLSSSTFFKNPRFPLPKTLNFTTISSSADKLWSNLQKNNFTNIEKTLLNAKAKLDSKCVNGVLQRFSVNEAQLGLRFFIWAGLQPNYRHSSYMYSEACKLFELEKRPGVIIDVIDGYRVENYMLSVKMFKVVLNLCREAKLGEEALWVLRKMKEFGVRPDTNAYNIVIRLLCEKNELGLAEELMKEMTLSDLYPDMITYVSMIKGFCNVGRLEDANGLINVMKEHGCSPNAVVYSSFLDGVSRFGSLERVLELLGEMEKEGGSCSPNVVTYTSVIQSLCEKGRSMEALRVLDQMEDCGCFPNRVTSRILITGLCKEGCLEEAYKLIDKLVAGGNVSSGECYSSLVVSLLQIRNVDEAEKLFKKMLAGEVKPNSLASSLMLKDLCSQGRILDAFNFYNEMEKIGFISSIDSDIYSILLVGLCQKDHPVEASKLANLMVKRGIRMKGPYVEKIMEHLQQSGDNEIILQLDKVRNVVE
ncbi:Pentatricopeptide repeat [Dillenia turbinata]|uniref:Pentatricopeptide repeat n=1 Tax=Dillenia turbinata TaxID=194707 RepID=A0AAN8VX71_9MAGN